MSISKPTKAHPFVSICLAATRYTGQLNLMVGAWNQEPNKAAFPWLNPKRFHGFSFTAIHHAQTPDVIIYCLVWTFERGFYFLSLPQAAK